MQIFHSQKLALAKAMYDIESLTVEEPKIKRTNTNREIYIYLTNKD